MSFDADSLFALLPAFERARDAALARQSRTAAEQEAIERLRARLVAAVRDDPDGADAQRLGRRLRRADAGPLRALVEVLAEQAIVLEEDLEQLYDDCFIETCAEWVVPYIGELVGARGTDAVTDDASFSRRAQVANTLAYRRRKGTAAVLEQIARDVTNRDAAVVEYFERLITSQYLNHLRPHSRATVSMRGLDGETRVDGPFSRAAHTVDVRHIGQRGAGIRGLRGRYNIPNIGLFLWRVRSLSATRSPARRVDARRYLVHPLGLETQLYNRPVSEDPISHLAEPANVPHALGRRALARRLGTHYGTDRALVLEVEGAEAPLAAMPGGTLPAIGVCDLRDVPDGQGGVAWAHAPSDKIGIDPVLGRIVFPQDQPPERDVRISYHYGFGGALGGGEYARTRTAATVPVVALSTGSAAGTLQEALDSLGGHGTVAIRDSGRYDASTGGGATITADEEASITVRAAARTRPTVVLGGDLVVYGGAGAVVTLDGLLVAGGRIRVPAQDGGGRANGLRVLKIIHTTLRPATASQPSSPPTSPPTATSGGIELIVESSTVTVEIERAIIGAVRAVDGAEVRIRDSIVDAGDASAVAYATLDGHRAGASLDIAESTVIGTLHARRLNASNSLFHARLGAGDPWPAPIIAERLQEGCARFSYLPLEARVPRRHRCRPRDAAEAARVAPVFCSLRYGDARYALLSTATAEAITSGADDQGEMGAFHHLARPRREAALRARLREYLRFGLEVGVFYAGEQEGE